MSRLIKNLFALIPAFTYRRSHLAPPVQEPLLANNATDSTVILGAGIIGLSTAYSLSGMSKQTIYVVDPASKACAGASGQCEGAIGDFGVENELSPLNQLSYELYQQLAEQHSGKETFGYSGMDVHALSSHGFDSSDPHLPWPVQEPEDISNLPAWLKVPGGWVAGLIANQTHCARLDPPKFCRFLQKECESRGVRFLFNTTALSAATDASQRTLTGIKVLNKDSKKAMNIPCKNVVISAGSWSGKVFSTLFPSSRLRIPSTEQQPAQDWLRLKIKKPRRSEAGTKGSCQQIWFSADSEDLDIHMSSFLDGEFYAAGGFVNLSDIPDTPDKVTSPSHVTDIIERNTREFLALGLGETVQAVGSGRAFLPRLTTNLPIMAKAAWDDLFLSKTKLQEHGSPIAARPVDDDSDMAGGVFVNTGHYLDGFALGLASGKAVSELIAGQSPSVDLSNFGFPKADEESGDSRDN